MDGDMYGSEGELYDDIDCDHNEIDMDIPDDPSFDFGADELGMALGLGDEMTQDYYNEMLQQRLQEASEKDIEKEVGVRTISLKARQTKQGGDFFDQWVRDVCAGRKKPTDPLF